MTGAAVDRFCNEIERVLAYMRKEYDLTYFEAVGVLTHIASQLSVEALDEYSEDNDDPCPDH